MQPVGAAAARVRVEPHVEAEATARRPVTAALLARKDALLHGHSLRRRRAHPHRSDRRDACAAIDQRAAVVAVIADRCGGGRWRILRVCGRRRHWPIPSGCLVAPRRRRATQGRLSCRRGLRVLLIGRVEHVPRAATASLGRTARARRGGA
eukprot:4460077-Prymnesium_polylepis.2